MTRTRAVAGSVALGLLSQAATMVVGLWLTRFVLDRLGQHDYGVWLILLQSLGYLALADIGVVAVLPRQTAFVTGRAAEAGALPALVGATARLVVWQTPVVAALCLGAWFLFPADWGATRAPLGLVLALFAVTFPLRLFSAVLQGLQDLVFLGWLQLTTWMLNTVTVVAALWAGWGLYALAVAWGVTQLVPPLLCWRRLARHHPGVLPAGLPVLGWAQARTHLTAAAWVSLGQLAHALATSADVLLVGALLGPAAVVPYAVTLKLITVIGNLPASVAHAAGPGLSQMRMGEPRAHLRRATEALAQAVLVATGVVACVIVAVNRGFVGWWVGPDRYAGLAVTLAGVTLMLVRHYATTVVFAVYSFGHERRLALVGLAEGVVGVLTALVLIPRLGVVGAPLAALVAAVFVVLPLILPTLARETETTVAGLLRAVLPFAARIALGGALAGAVGVLIAPRGPVLLAATALLATAGYAALMLPVALRPPLREYLDQILRVVRSRFRPAAPAGDAA